MEKTYLFKLNYKNKPCYLRQISSSEKLPFNNFIETMSMGNIFQSFEWGQLKKSYGWHPIPLIIESNNNILGAVTILKKRAGGMNMFYSPRGPIIDYDKNPDLLRIFQKGIIPLAQAEKAVFWRIDPELPSTGAGKATLLLRNTNFKDVPATNSFGGIQPKWVWRVPLKKNTEEQWALLKKSARRNIKKAIKAEVQIKEGTKEDLPVFYKLLQATAQRNNFLLRSLDYYIHVWNEFSPFPGFKIFIASHQGKPVSTALAIGFGQGVWDIYAGNTDDNKDIGASYLLTWELISWASQQGYHFYDLGGIAPNAPENSPLNGLKIFKSQFGGAAEEFIGEYDLVFQPATYKIWNWGKSAFGLVNTARKNIRALKK